MLEYRRPFGFDGCVVCFSSHFFFCSFYKTITAVARLGGRYPRSLSTRLFALSLLLLPLCRSPLSLHFSSLAAVIIATHPCMCANDEKRRCCAFPSPPARALAGRTGAGKRFSGVRASFNFWKGGAQSFNGRNFASVAKRAGLLQSDIGRNPEFRLMSDPQRKAPNKPRRASKDLSDTVVAAAPRPQPAHRPSPQRRPLPPPCWFACCVLVCGCCCSLLPPFYCALLFF